MKSHSVVMLGDLNPAIFSPDWVRKYLTFDADDGQEAEIQIIHSEIADFLVSDVRFTIERNRITITSFSHVIELVASLAIQMFAKILTHTPIWAYGVNFERHVDFGSFERRNELGRVLCPLAPWGIWAENFQQRDPKMNSGMESVTMKKIIRHNPNIFEQCTIQPSRLKDMNDSGVFFQLNNHYGDISQQAKNDEIFRKEMLDHLQDNVVTYSKNFDSIVAHFETMGGVNG